MRAYEKQVQAAVKSAGRGAFRLEIDATAPSHMISNDAIERIILPQLKQARAR
jgi:hypothetical protein